MCRRKLFSFWRKVYSRQKDLRLYPIDFYCGINETVWNHHPVDPGPFACIAPVYGSSERTRKENVVKVPSDCSVFEDSGAFSDSLLSRLTPKEAIERQLKHAAKYKYFYQVTGMASYDLLIDEKWQDGQRHKGRWSVLEAELAVKETIESAKFLSKHRYYIPDNVSLILSAQGVDASQYLDCVRRIAPFFGENDILGLGGWCIIGKLPKVMMPVFRETIMKAVPLAAQFTKRIHIWGVLYAPALGNLLWMCDQYGLKLSTDSSGPQVRPCRGSWGYMGWRNKTYRRPDVDIRGLERARHVRAVREWLERFRETKYYKEPKMPSYTQERLF